MWQWIEEKEQMEEQLSDMKCYQENFDQWQLSIEQIKQERDKVSIFVVCYYIGLYYNHYTAPRSGIKW